METYSRSEQRSYWGRKGFVWLAFLAMALLAVTGQKAQAQTSSSLKITMSPAMYPDFNPDATDYIVLAGKDSTVSVSVSAPDNTSVSIDGQAFRKQTFTTKVTKLTEGQSFKFVVSTPKGAKTYFVRRVPSDFPTWTLERPGTPQAEFYVIAPTLKVDFGAFRHYVTVVDNYGVPIWWLRGNTIPVDAKFVAKDRIGWINFGPGEEHSLDGTLTHTFFPAGNIGGGVDPHELLHLPNGNYVYIIAVVRGPVDLSPYGGPKNGSVLDNVVEEVAPDGTLVWSWSSFEHISPAETTPPWSGVLTGAGADAYHMNSVERTETGYVMSLRHLNAVIGIDRATGKRLWKLGGTPRPESLQYVGDAYSNFSGNHDARILPDGTLTVHDNGSAAGRPPRAVRYSLDTKAMTATLLEQITDPTVGYSGFTGSARRLPGGNWLMEWGGYPAMTELAGDGSLVFRLKYTDPFFSYRAAPVAFGMVQRTDLRNGMNQQYPRYSRN